MDEKFPLALPCGSVLAGQYIIERVLGQGGFGITYEAKDHKTEERVAIKEFFPDAMATRTNQITVSPFSGERGESYEYGKTCFLQEAETLAQFIGNENIIRVRSYFEENGTAYFVMDFIEGISFDEYIREHGGKVPYEEAARILIPVMDALSVVHSKGIVHRDVSPDNIYITKDGTVKLLDFGAARYSLGDKSRSLDVVLKHGFAPKEQYARHGRQGPFTDVYSLGATFYFALTGKRPPDSVERMDEDDLVSPSVLGVQIGSTEEEAILKALSVQPADRYQNMAAFKNALTASGQSQPQPTSSDNPPVIQRIFTAPSDAGQTAQAGANSSLPAGGMPGSPNPSLPADGMSASGGHASETQSRKKIPSKKTLIVAAGACAMILVGVLIGSAFRHGDDIDPATSGNAIESSASQSDEAAESGTQPLDISLWVTPDPTAAPETTTEPAATLEPTPEPTAVPVGDVSLVNTNMGNSLNGAIITAWDGKSIYMADERHSVVMEEDGNAKYLINPSDGIFSNLLTDEGTLYFLYEGYAFSYDLNYGSDADEISFLNDRYGGRLLRFLLTKDYYIACVQNGDDTATVCRVHRSNSEVTEYCTVKDEKCFTVSDDGWLYYAIQIDGGARINRMRLDTLQSGARALVNNTHGSEYTNLLVSNGFLYYILYNDSYSDLCIITKIPDDLSADKIISWDIGSELPVCTSRGDFGLNAAYVDGSVLYFYAASSEESEFPDLYQIKVNDDGSFDASLLLKESFAPCIVYYGKNHKVIYYHRVIDSDDISHIYTYSSKKYDSNGNTISE